MRLTQVCAAVVVDACAVPVQVPPPGALSK
jgi:hypothetical protein